MLLIGSTLIVFISLVAISIFIFKYKGESDFYSNCLKRIIPVLLIGLFAYWLPVDTLIEIRHHDHVKYAELYKKSLKDPTNKELQEELAREREKLSKEDN